MNLVGVRPKNVENLIPANVRDSSQFPCTAAVAILTRALSLDPIMSDDEFGTPRKQTIGNTYRRKRLDLIISLFDDSTAAVDLNAPGGRQL